jgi:hypothetical protein
VVSCRVLNSALTLAAIAGLGIATSCGSEQEMSSDRKPPKLDELPPVSEHQWAVAQGQHDGDAVVVQYNETVKRYAAHPELGFQVGVAVPLNSPNPGALPTPEESEQLHSLEDRLEEMVARDRVAILVAILTTGTMREFVLYTGDPEAVRVRLEEFQRSVVNHEVQFMIQPDPEWSVYHRLAP